MQGLSSDVLILFQTRLCSRFDFQFYSRQEIETVSQAQSSILACLDFLLSQQFEYTLDSKTLLLLILSFVRCSSRSGLFGQTPSVVLHGISWQEGTQRNADFRITTEKLTNSAQDLHSSSDEADVAFMAHSISLLNPAVEIFSRFLVWYSHWHLFSHLKSLSTHDDEGK